MPGPPGAQLGARAPASDELPPLPLEPLARPEPKPLVVPEALPLIEPVAPLAAPVLLPLVAPELTPLLVPEPPPFTEPVLAALPWPPQAVARMANIRGKRRTPRRRGSEHQAVLSYVRAERVTSIRHRPYPLDCMWERQTSRSRGPSPT
jgi:hypothetical protein